MKKIILSLFGLILIASCKQSTELIDRLTNQESKSYYPLYTNFIFNPINEKFEKAEYSGPRLDVIRDKDGIKGKYEVILNDGQVGNVYEEVEYTDLKANPEEFRVPVLSDFCQQTDDTTEFEAYKVRVKENNPQSPFSYLTAYVFSVNGKCDNDRMRCAAVYVQPEYNQQMYGLNQYPRIFDGQYDVLFVFGIEGTAINCGIMDSKVDPRPGCMDAGATNFQIGANIDDGSCTYPTYGCTDSNAINYNPLATNDDGSCVARIYGCTNPTALNFDPTANTDNGSCIFPMSIPGCTDSSALNYSPIATTNDGSCVYSGCTDPNADNYVANAITDDGSCVYFMFCSDPYNSMNEPVCGP